MAQSSSSPQQLHITVFPFMSKGHTIPLLHLTKLIHKHRPQATFTIFTTQGNQPFISAYFSSFISANSKTISIISLPFPSSSNEIPAGVESTDQLPSMSLFFTFALSTEKLQPLFEKALENLQKPISFLISDGFLYWTHESASKLNIPSLAFYGMNVYAYTLSRVVFENKLFSKVVSEDEMIQVPDFPWIKVRKDDIDAGFNGSSIDPQSPQMEFLIKCGAAISMTSVMLVNSFYELEKKFVDYCNNSKSHLKHYCVGPFCLVENPAVLENKPKPAWLEWLDQKQLQGESVLYVAFGTQAEISKEQLKEITIGLENSGVHFLWVLRRKPPNNQQEEEEEEAAEVIERAVQQNKGLVVRGWAEQRVILEHKSVKGFLSHCGWNSVMESICAGVPLLCWPMMAEQHMNAKMVEEEIQVGLRVETCDGSPRGFVKWEGLSKMVKELMQGEMGIKLRNNVKELSEVASKAIQKGGSSWNTLEALLNQFQMGKIMNHNNI